MDSSKMIFVSMKMMNDLSNRLYEHLRFPPISSQTEIVAPFLDWKNPFTSWLLCCKKVISFSRTSLFTRAIQIGLYFWKWKKLCFFHALWYEVDWYGEGSCFICRENVQTINLLVVKTQSFIRTHHYYYYDCNN